MVGWDKYGQRGLKKGIKVEAERDRSRSRSRGGKEAVRNRGRDG
jgi:hypothetical protein